MTDDQSAIACNLSSSDVRRQRAAYRQNLTPFLTNVACDDGATQLSFSKPEVTRSDIERLIAQENDCCAFLVFDLDENEAELILTVMGPEGSEDIVRGFFLSASNNASSNCGCAGADAADESNGKRYIAGFITICAIGCATPPILVALGLTSLATAASLGKGIDAVIVLVAVMALAGLLVATMAKRSRKCGHENI